MYYVMIETAPSEDNEEKNTCGGAFLDCWVKAETEEAAVEAAKEYAAHNGWEYISTEEVSIAERENYSDDKETLEVYDEACRYDIAGVFYMWPT